MMNRTYLLICISFCTLSMLVFWAVFFFTKGYPTQNDIFSVLEISSLSSEARWINGFYGPGYSVISVLIGPNVQAFGALFCFLISVFQVLGNAELWRSDVKWRGAACAAFTLSTTLFFLWVGFNYTDGLYLGFLFIGLYQVHFMLKKNKYKDLIQI